MMWCVFISFFKLLLLCAFCVEQKWAKLFKFYALIFGYYQHDWV